MSKSTTVCSINDVYSTTSKSPCALFILKAKIGFKKITVHSLGKQLQAEVNYLQEVCKLIENQVYNTNNALFLAVKEYFTNAVPWQQSQHEHLRGNYSSFLWNNKYCNSRKFWIRRRRCNPTWGYRLRSQSIFTNSRTLHQNRSRFKWIEKVR